MRLLRVERVGEGWAVELEAGGTAYSVGVRREQGEPTHLTCSTEALRRPNRYVAEEPVAGSPRARAS